MRIQEKKKGKGSSWGNRKLKNPSKRVKGRSFIRGKKKRNKKGGEKGRGN